MKSRENGLLAKFPPSRVTFLAVDLAKPDFGLQQAVLDEVFSTTTQIIHNAWLVDFNKTLQSFRPILDGVFNLVASASRARLSPSLLFISSISSVMNY